MLLKKIKFCSLIFIFFVSNEVLIADNYKNTKFIEDIKIEFDQSKNRDFVPIQSLC